MDLRGKRVLLIAPIFYDYEALIKSKLEKFGAIVTFVPERDYSFIFKIVNNFFNYLLPLKQRIHYRKIDVKGYDILLVIRGYMMPVEFVKRFKNINPTAKTILYQWDSNKNNPYKHLISYFNIVKSFDYKDCETFNIEYLPLFYTDDISQIRDSKEDLKYDFFILATYFPSRFERFVKFKYCVDKTQYKLKSHIFIAKTSLKKEQMQGNLINTELVSTSSMPRAEYLKILKQSKVVVDMSHEAQSGLSMRVIEALALKKKIYTTNPLIANEPYFNSDIIKIIDIDNLDFNDEFISGKFTGDCPVLSIEEWIKSLLCIK